MFKLTSIVTTGSNKQWPHLLMSSEVYFSLLFSSDTVKTKENTVYNVNISEPIKVSHVSVNKQSRASGTGKMQHNGYY